MANSPTALKWPYPLLSPSYRFNQYNNLVRGLDVRFAGLSPDDAAAWAALTTASPWLSRCVPWIYDYDPFDTDGTTAVAAYRGVNAARVLQGLSVSDSVPTINTAPDNDVLLISGSEPYAVTWFGRSDAPSTDYVATVRAVGLMHPPERGPALQKYTFAAAAPIMYGELFTIEPFLPKLLGIAQMPVMGVAISVSDLGSNAFFGGRLTFPRGG